MDIFDALRLLAQGKKIRFRDWGKEEYVYLNEKNVPVFSTNSNMKWVCLENIFTDKNLWEEYIEPPTKQRFVKIVLWNPKTKKFVDIDSSSGYPYEVNANKAYDFGTIEKAKNYQSHFPEYKIGQLVSFLEFTE